MGTTMEFALLIAALFNKYPAAFFIFSAVLGIAPLGIWFSVAKLSYRVKAQTRAMERLLGGKGGV